MSVASKNPFDLLGDDGDDSSPVVTKPAPKAAAPAAEAKPARNVPGAQARGGAGGRGGRGGNRGGRSNNEQRDTGVPQDDGGAEGFQTAGGFDGERVANSKGNHKGPDAHTKGPRGSRPNKNFTSGGHTSSRGGRASGPGTDGAERRQYERRSGTNPDTQKKIESGWGADSGAAELKAEVEGEQDAHSPDPADPAAEESAAVAGAEGTTETAAAAVEPEEPEEITKSYDEYLAEKAASTLNIEKKERRQVTGDLEGQAFHREEVDDFFGAKTQEKSTKAKSAPKKAEKVFIPVDGTFATPPGGSSERGGRGGARGGGARGGGSRGGFGGEGRGGARGGRGGARGGRGAPRGAGAGAGGAGGRGNQNGGGVDASDEKAFPALGAKA